MSSNTIPCVEREQVYSSTDNIASDLASAFSLEFKLGGFEGGWKYYTQLSTHERALLRSFHSDNGVLDFSNYLLRIQRSRPCGMASKVEKLQLMDRVNEELKSLPEEERKTYLNGNPLVFEL